ncbi:MAG: CxxxxCH/CxxCH domain-containing protein [Pseudomonadota bacterium]
MNERKPTQPNQRGRSALGYAATVLVAVVSFALGPSCLERREDPALDSSQTRCAVCHGDPSRAGDYLRRSAPPRDLSGASTSAYPGVGAHSIHLDASNTHGQIACSECHVVPERTDSPGHADSARPAPLAFGALATSLHHSPSYDPVARTCNGSYCHGDHAGAVWTEPRSSQAACGSCHGLPPPLPHPQSQRCAACHAQVIAADGHFVDPTLHVNGQVEAEPGACTSCHGSDDNPAPPLDTLGNQQFSAVGVGAHRAHLSGGQFSRPLACSECHVVPTSDNESDHIQGMPARVVLSGVAATDHRTPSWDRAALTCAGSWCHGPGSGATRESPVWTANQDLTCTSCHGAPPPAPHPQLSNCSHCHGAVVGPDDHTIVDRTRHVDGVVDVSFSSSCTSCHGSSNSAPPNGVNNETSTDSAAVGAHQAHLNTGDRARAVQCSDCHVVPRRPLDPGHIDTPLPAEVTFSSVASAFLGTPAYQNGSCVQVSCHGGKFPGTHRSGGSNVSPVWTQVDGTQATCGSCHSLPPPAPHPYQNDCSTCHEDMAPGNLTFSHPELHVDGVVTFTVP